MKEAPIRGGCPRFPWKRGYVIPRKDAYLARRRTVAGRTVGISAGRRKKALEEDERDAAPVCTEENIPSENLGLKTGRAPAPAAQISVSSRLNPVTTTTSPMPASAIERTAHSSAARPSSSERGLKKPILLE